jgi:CBS-domain-containing membrane protein
MPGQVRILADKFRAHWKNYVGQSAFATIIFTVILVALNVQMRPIVTASVGATAFIVFAIPSDVTANTKNIIGGHLIGVFAGSLSAWLASESSALIFYSLAVGLSIFLMVITDCEHPPASGTALGLSVSGASLDIIITLMVCVVALAGVRKTFRQYLRDLR